MGCRPEGLWWPGLQCLATKGLDCWARGLLRPDRGLASLAMGLEKRGTLAA